MPTVRLTAIGPGGWRVLALLLCAALLASVARFYHPRTGFSGLISLPHATESTLPALRELPHAQRPAEFTYDGQFYAQLALEPLLRDPAIDRALDNPPYRARRILFSWTAFVLGLGRPAWIIQAYALQNVACWLLLAWVLTRWIPPRSGRCFALWSACLFSHGLLGSVHYALLDGPSLLLVVCAAAFAERNRRWPFAAIIGAAALGRETNLLAVVMTPVPCQRRQWLPFLVVIAIGVLPLLVWYDYVWSIYRTTMGATDAAIFAAPFSAYLETWQRSITGVTEGGIRSPAVLSLVVVLSVSVQAAYLALHRNHAEPWWRLAAAYTALILVVHPVVWHGYPGAVTRVALPATVGFNILLARNPSGFWLWYVLGNLHVIPGLAWYFLVPIH